MVVVTRGRNARRIVPTTNSTSTMANSPMVTNSKSIPL